MLKMPNPSQLTTSMMLLFLVGSAQGEELLTDQDVYAEPQASAAVAGKIKKGTVSVSEKKGFWVKIKSGETAGWTKLSNVKAASSGSIGLPDTGRASSGNIVATSGVRGLDGNDLVNAKPDIEEFNKLKSQGATKQQGSDFASSGNVLTRKINYVQTVNK